MRCGRLYQEWHDPKTRVFEETPQKCGADGCGKNGCRAEITDAAMSERAECVMLNKGLFILRAISELDNVVNKMQAHQRKKISRLRALQW
jgi:hypothetical protein